MGITLSAIKNNVRKIEVDYFGDKFFVKYRPSELTPEVESRLQNAGRQQEEGSEEEQKSANEVLIDILCNLLVDWEVLDEKGVPIPIDGPTLVQLPSAFLSHILQACREDMLPKPKSGRR